MRCYHCESELIWGGDEDLIDEEEWSMVTNLTCSRCHSDVLVYLPCEDRDDDA